MPIASVIVCVDCGGRAHLVMPFRPDEQPVVGEFLTYRCEDCLDRWDLEITEEDVEPA